jgi:uncharacterized protein
MTSSGTEQLTGPLTAGPRTDRFIDPVTGTVSNNSPVTLIDAPAGNFQFAAYVRATLLATFDAGALVVDGGPGVWAKFALERNPEGADTIVSVITRGVSDDANCVVVPDPGQTWLRISRIGTAYALHYSSDGTWWSLARVFTLGPTESHRIGVTTQSPTGDGLTATFSEVTLRPATLGDLRDGS